MKAKILNAVKYIFFLSLGVFLFWYVYRDQKIDNVLAEIKKTNFNWIWLSLFFGLLSHVSRAVRWQMMAKSLGYKPKFTNSFFSVMATYITNLALPRLGEIARPSIIKKYEKIPFAETLGTIILERLIDVIILLVLTVFVVFVEFKTVVKFVDNNPDVALKFQNFNYQKLAILAVVILLVLIFAIIIFRKKFKHTKLYIKLLELFKSFYNGFKSFKKIDKKFWFIFHSVFIWIMYILMIYISFFAFKFTEDITIIQGLTIFVAGSYGMVAPVQGGIGAWHFMVISTLLIFGVTFNDAQVFALVVHSMQTLLIIFLGSISLIALPIFNRKINK